MYAGGSPTFNEMGTGGQYSNPTQSVPANAPQPTTNYTPENIIPNQSIQAQQTQARIQQAQPTAMYANAQRKEQEARANTSPVRADVYNKIHPYAKPLQAGKGGMAMPPPSYQAPAWMNMKVEPGNKEQFAARRAAQVAENNRNTTTVQGANGMQARYSPGFTNLEGMGAYMNDTLHGRAPSGGNSVPSRGLGFKGR